MSNDSDWAGTTSGNVTGNSLPELMNQLMVLASKQDSCMEHTVEKFNQTTTLEDGVISHLFTAYVVTRYKGNLTAIEPA